jgi:2-polyprenyl-6-methoxyphenol hydroxylase-like FAD-dependent oxidoreductase
VGAGPVGMFTALNLAKRGAAVRIADMASGPAGHSYACALHCRSLQLLEEAGVEVEGITSARSLDRIAFYEGNLRRAEIPFAGIVPDTPHMLVLPQCDLEEALADRLEESGVQIMWNHHLADLRGSASGMVATLEEIGGSVSGYAVPRWEPVVKRSIEVATPFVIGCDGRNSAVRQLGGIGYESLATPELFVVYEFDSSFNMPDESRVVLNRDNINVLWPMKDRRFRWSFQWTKTQPDGEFPAKDRSHIWAEDRPVAERTKAHLEEMIRERAPWFDGTIENVNWATDVQFEHCLAPQFGSGRCWLAGDAAHQTGPVGVQSMNVGMHEATVLARHMEAALHEDGTIHALEEYGEEFLSEWQRLLGISADLEPLEPGMPAPIRNRDALIETLPAHGPELDAMLAALGFRLQAYAFPTGERR